MVAPKPMGPVIPHKVLRPIFPGVFDGDGRLKRTYLEVV